MREFVCCFQQCNHSLWWIEHSAFKCTGVFIFLQKCWHRVFACRWGGCVEDRVLKMSNVGNICQCFYCLNSDWSGFFSLFIAVSALQCPADMPADNLLGERECVVAPCCAQKSKTCPVMRVWDEGVRFSSSMVSHISGCGSLALHQCYMVHYRLYKRENRKKRVALCFLCYHFCILVPCVVVRVCWSLPPAHILYCRLQVGDTPWTGLPQSIHSHTHTNGQFKVFSWPKCA